MAAQLRGLHGANLSRWFNFCYESNLRRLAKRNQTKYLTLLADWL